MVRKSFVSQNLTRIQVERAYAAGAFAYCSGHPLNEFVTIHFKAAGVDRPSQFLSRFLKQANDWSRRNTGKPACWIKVFENPPIRGDKLGGLHVHILIHVPSWSVCDFREAAGRWIELAGGTMTPSVLVCKSVHYGGPKDDHEEYLESGLLGMLRYFSKGINPKASPDFGIRSEHQGPISGKRCGYSESLGERRRWLPAERPGSRYTIGPDSIQRRFAKAVCPALFEFPPYQEE